MRENLKLSLYEQEIERARSFCSALKWLYHALIRSVIDFGCVAYRLAADSLLKRLDVVQVQALSVLWSF